MVSKKTRTAKGLHRYKHYTQGFAIRPNSRIYAVVADTVQCPAMVELATNPLTNETVSRVAFDPEALRVTQPYGRQTAQHGHVVSRVREWMTREFIKALFETRTTISRTDLPDVFWDDYCEPVTTIVKSARDSFELQHVKALLLRAGIRVHQFEDFDQPDYGDVNLRVTTAICTVPVLPEEVVGILDYLPLLVPKKV